MWHTILTVLVRRVWPYGMVAWVAWMMVMGPTRHKMLQLPHIWSTAQFTQCNIDVNKTIKFNVYGLCYVVNVTKPDLHIVLKQPMNIISIYIYNSLCYAYALYFSGYTPVSIDYIYLFAADIYIF